MFRGERVRKRNRLRTPKHDNHHYHYQHWEGGGDMAHRPSASRRGGDTATPELVEDADPDRDTP